MRSGSEFWTRLSGINPILKNSDRLFDSFAMTDVSTSYCLNIAYVTSTNMN